MSRKPAAVAALKPRPDGELVRWTLTDVEHRAYRRAAGRAARWPLPIRVGLMFGIAGGFAWALSLATSLEAPAIIAGSVLVFAALVAISVLGTREPARLPPCTVVLTIDGYQSAGARAAWGAFGGLSAATIETTAPGVQVVRVVGAAGWAELPLAAEAREVAERACQAILAKHRAA